MALKPNILVIRLKSIGDVVLTLPALSVLRDSFPTAKISFLTSTENAPLLRGFRDVDETIPLDRTALRCGNPLRMSGEFFGLLRRLRTGQFSLAVDLQGNGESAWLTRITGAPQRWGTVQRPARRWAFTQCISHQHQLHAAESHLELLRHCGLKASSVRNEFKLPTEALTAARAFFAENKLAPEKPTIFLQPLTSSSIKNWPLEHFLALARHWQSHGWQVLFGGGPADGPALEPSRAAGFVISAGVPLLVTGGLMQLSTLIVGGDTGALHLAVAQGRRVVMLMRNDWPGRPHPFRHPEWSLLPPEDGNITSIPVATVMAACEQVLAKMGSGIV